NEWRVTTKPGKLFHFLDLMGACDGARMTSRFHDIPTTATAWHARMVSKAFTKGDGAEEPPFVAPRAPLPAGAPNYVTPRGLALLRSELGSLEASRSSIPLEASADAASARAALQTRIQELKA